MNFTINFFLNGTIYQLQIKKYITLQQVVQLLYGKTQGIVLEYNKNIVTVEMCNKIYIKSNDRLEILTIVGGG
tara:strand:+ start:147 stop:365 length:219 start_codon:yes stop_codon:yes gene_type:complete